MVASRSTSVVSVMVLPLVGPSLVGGTRPSCGRNRAEAMTREVIVTPRARTYPRPNEQCTDRDAREGVAVAAAAQPDGSRARGRRVDPAPELRRDRPFQAESRAGARAGRPARRATAGPQHAAPRGRLRPALLAAGP